MEGDTLSLEGIRAGYGDFQALCEGGLSVAPGEAVLEIVLEFTRNRIIDLSRKAAQQLDMLRTGVAPVRVVSTE